MNVYDLLPTKKVTAFVLGGAVTIALFWLLIEMDVLEGWPEAWVMAAWAIIFGFIAAWVVPPGAWRDIELHLEGTVGSPSRGETRVSGDVNISPSGEGTANIEGEVDIEE